MSRPARRLRTAHTITDGRYVAQDMDLSRDRPIMLGGYSYPHPPRFGQVEGVADLRTEERSRCHIRNHRHYTVVNGVCLDCCRARGKYRGSR